jgi:hypothetical protein
MCEAATEDVAVEACGEEDETASEGGELVAVAAGQSFQEALAEEAAEIVGHLAHGLYGNDHVCTSSDPVPAGRRNCRTAATSKRPGDVAALRQRPVGRQ